MPVSQPRTAALILSTGILGGLLTGCTLATTSTPGSSAGTSIAGAHLAGVVHGGSQPIVKARVYLLAANPAGYGSPSLSLLTSAATGNAVDTLGAYSLTDATTGAFALAGDYDCTQGYTQGADTTSGATTLSGSEQVYLYILGGNTGAGTNANSGMLAALGPCNAQYASTGLIVNEVTTIAAAYAFAGYATDATHLASSGTPLALTGLSNAGLNSANLASITTGLPLRDTTGIIRPFNAVYTLADILASCVNGTTGNSNCATLFQYTESSGATGTAPTDTATAAINLAHNPYPTAAGMTALYGLVPAIGSPFTFPEELTAQPNDFTLGIDYRTVAYTSPTSIAIDAAGNAWIANLNSPGSISELSSTGNPISPTDGYAGTPGSPSAGYTGGGIDGPQGIAIDAVGNVWISNDGSRGSVSELSSSGNPISPSTGYVGGGIDGPWGIAVDAVGDIWTANDVGNSVSELSSSGNPISTSTGYVGGGLNEPSYLAFDIHGNAWIVSRVNSSFAELSSTGNPISPSTGYTNVIPGGANGIAIDASDNIWVAYGDTYPAYPYITKYSSSGSPLLSASTSNNNYYGIAIDGSGNAWTANTSNGVLEFSSSITPVSSYGGYIGSGIDFPVNITIDGSGDVWVGNISPPSVSELIGAAAPVVTPIVANLISPYGKAAVNRP